MNKPQNDEPWMEPAKRAEMITFLHASRADIDAGRTKPAIQALDQLAKKHGLKEAARNEKKEPRTK